MQTNVTRAWTRIANALKKNYPDVRLNSGVHADELKQLAPPGFSIPNDFSEMYLTHDSIERYRPFLLGQEPLAASNIKGFHHLFSANLELAIDTNHQSYFDNEEHGVQGYRYFDGSATLIPFTDGSSCYLCVESCIDTTSAAHGRVVYMDMDNDSIEVVCSSIAVLLDNCAGDFESAIYDWDEYGFSVELPEEISLVEYFQKRWRMNSG